MELATGILFAFEWLGTTTTLPSRSRSDIKGEALGEIVVCSAQSDRFNGIALMWRGVQDLHMHDVQRKGGGHGGYSRRGCKCARVTAEVNDGLVTLHGVVERAYQKSCAEASVLKVSGVTGVRNEIAVRAAEEVNQPALQS